MLQQLAGPNVCLTHQQFVTKLPDAEGERSDIPLHQDNEYGHIEPMTDRVLLRYRIDGVCHVRDNLPKRMQSALLARLKLMAGMNIAERPIPQDGRINMPGDGEVSDLRRSP